jgi:hypothetical protein
MIIYHIGKSAAVQAIVGSENPVGSFCGFMLIRKRIDQPVKGDTLLYTLRIIEFLFSFYKIADQVAREYFRIVKRQICVGQVINE